MPRSALWLVSLNIVLILPGCSSTSQPAADAGADRTPTDAVRSDAESDPSLVLTANGLLRGTVSEKHRAFLGIPYAQPPTGSLRWVAPQPYPSWNGIREAKALGPGCYQQQFQYFDFAMAEDCLTVNVWTPNPVPASPAPVVVFVHGGNWEVGSSAQPEFNGHHMAEMGGVVVVTLNYRLGPLGFLVHPSLKPETGNFGILDQQAALKWVRDNIKAFGGDPNNVTIIGDSAGGWSMCLHLTSPGSQGLFQHVMMMSGFCLDGLWTVAQAEKQGAVLAAGLGCDKASDVAACMRGKDVKDVVYQLKINPAMVWGSDYYWRAVIDGKTIVDQPLSLVRAGKFAKVPVILGATKDEGSLFVYLESYFGMTDEGTQNQLKKTFGTYAADVLKLYPSQSFATPSWALALPMGDANFDCYARRTARALAAAGVPTYAYQFAGTGEFMPPMRVLESFHTLDLYFLFHNPWHKIPNPTFTEAERNLSKKIIAHVTQFARTGDPSITGETTWPLFSKQSPGYTILGMDQIKAANDLKPAECDFWDTLPPALCGNGGCGAAPLE